MHADTAKAVASYEHHVINSQRLEIRPRTFKELRTEPYFPWQRQENNKEMPWQKYNEMHEKLVSKNIQMGPYESVSQRQPKGKKMKGPGPKPGRAKDSEGQDIVPIELTEFKSYLEQHQCVGVRGLIVQRGFWWLVEWLWEELGSFLKIFDQVCPVAFKWYHCLFCCL